MWGGLVGGLLARPWVRRAAGCALVALTITMFILNLRRPRSRDDLLDRLRADGF
jgi:hypothetical protein